MCKPCLEDAMITSFPVKKNVFAHSIVGNLKPFRLLFISKLVRWVVSFVQAFLATYTDQWNPILYPLFALSILKAINAINLFTQRLRVANTIARWKIVVTIYFDLWYFVLDFFVFSRRFNWNDRGKNINASRGKWVVVGLSVNDCLHF